MNKILFAMFLLGTLSACADKEEDYSSVSSDDLLTRQAEIDAELASRDIAEDPSNNEAVLNGAQNGAQQAPVFSGPPNMTCYRDPYGRGYTLGTDGTKNFDGC